MYRLRDSDPGKAGRGVWLSNSGNVCGGPGVLVLESLTGVPFRFDGEGVVLWVNQIRAPPRSSSFMPCRSHPRPLSGPGRGVSSGSVHDSLSLQTRTLLGQILGHGAGGCEISTLCQWLSLRTWRNLSPPKPLFTSRGARRRLPLPQVSLDVRPAAVPMSYQ